MASLRDLQVSFAAAMRDPSIACGVSPPSNLDIYRNNAEFGFRSALEAGFPVLRRRVGEDYFRQLSFHYRARFPSRSGDLHWAGQHFAAFLDEHLRSGEYAWLADLARIEWARQRAAVSIELPAIGADALTAFATEELEQLVFTLQPSLSLISSAYPVFSIWLANQVENAPPVDQSLASEQCLILKRDQSLEVRALPERLFSCFRALADGATLGESMTAAELDEQGISESLRFLFSEKLITAVAIKNSR